MSSKCVDAHTLRNLPSVTDVLREPGVEDLVELYGRPALLSAIRSALGEARAGRTRVGDTRVFLNAATSSLERTARRSLRPLYNLTGTILHTNLGRAVLSEAAIDAALVAMRETVSLEFDVSTSRRGERDDHVRGLLQDLTGAEDATVVNNNAAAIMLVLNTLSCGREAIVSRGELIEIGGSFRMPDIMARAGAKLVEVGTTNRTHPTDYIGAIRKRTGLILRVHTSNYRIEGFTRATDGRELASIAMDNNIPFVNDLGSGTMVDLSRFGLSHEPTVAESIKEGADIVTFSGDKLLGGPQAGFIVGRKDLIERINRNPMKRALRLDKIRLAALEATLKLYRDPDKLARTIPTFRILAKSRTDVHAAATRLARAIESAVGSSFSVTVIDCASQVGSGALPLVTIASAGVALRSARGRGTRALNILAASFRQLPLPVIGRIENNALIFDMRCLNDEQGFVANLKTLVPEAKAGRE
jgi:L-seryl-tRNA(Ser) seleniumtransferase